MKTQSNTLAGALSGQLLDSPGRTDLPYQGNYELAEIRFWRRVGWIVQTEQARGVDLGRDDLGDET